MILPNSIRPIWNKKIAKYVLDNYPKFSVGEISKKIKVSKSSIFRFLKINHIKIMPLGYFQKNKIARNRKLPSLKKLKQLYFIKKLSCRQIARKYKATPTTVKAQFKKHNIKLRSTSETTYKGSKQITKYGYITMIPPHEYRHICGNKSKMEHRIVMEIYLNRPLKNHENVHHINGNRQDNRIENLQLWSKVQPSGQRVIDKIEYAKEILALYEEEYKKGLIK